MLKNGRKQENCCRVLTISYSSWQDVFQEVPHHDASQLLFNKILSKVFYKKYIFSIQKDN